jgi:hypothetical protein
VNLISYIRFFPYQSFFFALFIGISIYFPNRTYFPIDVMILPMGLLFSIIAVALIISKYAHLDLNKSQMFISCALILNYTYFIFRNDEVSLGIWPYLSLITMIYALIFILLIAVVWKTTSSQASNLSRSLNILAIIVVLIGLANYGLSMLSEAHDNAAINQDPEFEAQFQKYLTENLTSPLNNRDFYFIILDRYPGKDTLYAEYGFNNSDFYRNLTDMAFHCDNGQSKSNYGFTLRSIPSMLNMDYYDLAKQKGYDEENNRLWKFFKTQGYKFVYLESNWPTTANNSNADISLNPFYVPVEYPNYSSNYIFQRIMFIERTFLGYVYYQMAYRLFDKDVPLSITNFEWMLNNPEANWDAKLKSNNEIVRSHVLNTFDNLTQVPKIPGKKFTISHIDGWINVREGTYLDKVRKLNQLTESTLKEIIKESEISPVIILISDHGLKAEAKAIKSNFSTFENYACYSNESLTQEYIGSCWYNVNNIEAFYLPESGNASIYPGITPVNVWRNVLNYYFGTHFSRIEDRSYWYSPDDGICEIGRQ